jgi:hypothetical protein
MINLNVINDPVLSFWHTQQVDGSDQDLLTVYYKTSTSGTWTQLATYTTNILAWTQRTISLPISSPEFYICFEGNAKWGYGVCIDDVSITGVPKIQTNLSILNDSVKNGEASCFNAYDTITVAGDGSTVEFQSGSSVDLIAGNTIRFLPGFHAYEGSYAHAWITEDETFCDGGSGSIVMDPSSEKSIDSDRGMPIKEQDSGNRKSIKVYPNPNNGKFILEVTKLANVAEVKVYNALGTMVYHAKVEDGQATVNLSGIGRGLYVVMVTDGKEQLTRKIVVN